MKRRFVHLATIIIGLLGIGIGIDSIAQVQPQSMTLDDATRREAVATAAGLLRNRYIFPDVGEQAARALEAALADGSYDGISDYRAFAMRLTDDLRAVANDKHLRVSAPGAPPPAPVPAPVESPAAAPAAPTQSPASAPAAPAQSPAAAPAAPAGAPAAGPPLRPRDEGGVTRADILGDNVGYLEIVAFPPPFSFNGPTDRAMAALKDTRALIIDVRRNGGGSPESVTHLVSYFLDGGEPVHINTFVNRTPETESFTTREFWSESTPFSYMDKPVYVLTSDFTFSGGEEFAYDMQVMDLAELIGDTTGGGANPGGNMPIAAGLAMFVPGGRAENPITGTNWEGVGVIPDIGVPSEDALAVALKELGVSPAAKDIDVASVARVFEPTPPRTERQPGSEAAVRRLSDEVARGEPDYESLTPDMAEVTRNQLPMLQQRFASLGAIESVTFVEVAPNGVDVYDVHYANGGVRWMIALDEEGRTAMAGIQPLPGQP